MKVAQSADSGASAGSAAAEGLGTDSPRSGNTGGISRPEATVRCDWLRATGPSEFTVEEWGHVLSRYLGTGITVTGTGRGKYGYAECWRVEVDFDPSGDGAGLVLGHICFGGQSQRGTCLFELTGGGCEWAELHGYGLSGIAGWLKGRGFRLTRVDVCADFLLGEVTLEQCVEHYHAGNFRTGPGRALGVQYIDDFGTGKGRTLYVGSRKDSEKFVRCYEKGKQLGARTSPWLRIEAEFKRGDSELDWRIVHRPASALVAAVPWLEGMLACAAEAVRSRLVRLRTTADQLILHAASGVGKLVNVMMRELRYQPHEVVRLLRRPGVPKRLVGVQYLERGSLALGAI